MAPKTLQSAARAGPGKASSALPGPLRCLVVDDHEGFLRAARALLEREGLEVAGVARTAARGLRLARELHPDVVLVDIFLGPDDGFELARQLWEDEPGPARAVVLISTHTEADFADLVEASPAAGFVPKWDLSARAVRELYAQHKAKTAKAPWQRPSPSDGPPPHGPRRDSDQSPNKNNNKSTGRK
jgi:DNA-binding NarL/FixJ family response regulator